MPENIKHHNVRRHWPKAGIHWSTRTDAKGKCHTDPLPGKGVWLKRIRRAIDSDARGPQIMRAKESWVDLCFTELIMAATKMNTRLAETDLYTFIAEVKPQVPWAQDLSARILTELFITLMVGRAMWKLHPSPPLDRKDHCLAARSLDNFNDSLKAWAAWVDFEVSCSGSSGDGIMKQGGVEHFRARGLIDPTNLLINSQLAEGFDRLAVNCMFQRVDQDLVQGIQRMTVNEPQGEASNDVSGKDAGPSGSDVAE